MRTPRPHIPIATRVEVAERQLGVCFVGTLARRLDWALKQLFGDEDYHLDHDPPLAARHKRFSRAGAFIDFDPPANSPLHLIYRTKEKHRVKTYVRGEHGQFSDRMLINRAKRRERKQTKPRAKILHGATKLRGLTFQQQRCRMRAGCTCDARERKRCKNYR